MISFYNYCEKNSRTCLYGFFCEYLMLIFVWIFLNTYHIEKASRLYASAYEYRGTSSDRKPQDIDRTGTDVLALIGYIKRRNQCRNRKNSIELIL